ncbi:adenosine 3'-phospho 5'-phosphosulfate transporter [Skeletonema marinoi]|uniref:Adenosine 3'-phospho 5'-phosphosulfate transporter n=1 Tax=Skeletonema marinoi TaxID=267567 RepID=A0AAD8YLX5_9STRA|nr:adenosine 3'-phospho 5'-phosphosulfate transporter [Skeletonema marinoi]
MENRPLLSPTAEAALLELSTNFLLYCAMVLITTMVAKIYFPSWLEPREAPTPQLSHNYMDVIRDSYKSDLSDEDEDEDEEELMGGLLNRTEEGEHNNPESSDEGATSLRRASSSSHIFDYDQSSESKQEYTQTWQFVQSCST